MTENEMIVKNFLLDSENSDINSLAHLLDFNIIMCESRNTNAISFIDTTKDTKKIGICYDKITSSDMLKFAVAYEIAYYVLYDFEGDINYFEIDNIDLKAYKLAKIIYDKCYKEKEEQKRFCMRKKD